MSGSATMLICKYRCKFHIAKKTKMTIIDHISVIPMSDCYIYLCVDISKQTNIFTINLYVQSMVISHRPKLNLIEGFCITRKLDILASWPNLKLPHTSVG